MSALETVKTIKSRKKMSKKHVNLDPTDGGGNQKHYVVNEVKQQDKHLVIAFADANPPTDQHIHLANTVRYHAGKTGGEGRVYLSHGNSKAKPLPYSQKFIYAQKALGKDVVHHTSLEDLEDIVKSLHGKASHLTIVTGKDTMPKQRETINKRNGFDYNFKQINFVSSANKHPDRYKGPGSSSKLRTTAIKGDQEGFKKNLPKVYKKDRDFLYSDIRRGAGIREQLNEAFDQFVNNVNLESHNVK